MGRKLFVGNLNFKTSSDDLRELFGQVGTCESAQVMMDRATGRSRGFGFVEMSTDEEAAQASEKFNGYQLGGRALRVNAAEDRPRGAGGGGGGRGFGGGGGRGGGGYGGGGYGGGGGDYSGGGGGYGGGGGDYDGGGWGGGGGAPGGGGKAKGSRRNIRGKKRSL